jgi:hypothetical protein
MSTGSLPDLMYTRAFGAEPIETVDRVMMSNMVMHACMQMSPATFRRRAGRGIRVAAKKTGALRRPTGQFACSLIQPVGLPGMIMRYVRSVIRVGKFPQAGSLFVIMSFLHSSGDMWPTGITVPNSVATVYFNRVVTKTVRKSVRAVPCKKFNGQRLILAVGGSKHTPTVHLGWKAKTRVQTQSKCTVPGTRTAAELRAYVEGVERILLPHFE